MSIRPVSDEYVIAGEMTLHYVQWGKKGTPVVLVHGLTANAFFFQALADGLADQHQVFAYDLRGRGDSDRPEDDYSIPTHALDLLEFLDGLDLDKPIILGHSLGASIALYFAAHYPERISKLILLDGGAPLPWKTPEETPGWLQHAVGRVAKPFPSYKVFIEQMKAQPYLGASWSDYHDLYFKNDIRPEGDGSVISKAELQCIVEEGKRAHEGRPEEQWAGVRVPTLLIRAGEALVTEGDQVLSEAGVAQVQESIADCQFVNYPDLNHYSVVFQAEKGPLQTIRSFIS